MRPKSPLVVIPIVAGIGNALMAQPMVRQLKRAWADARIIVMARTGAMGQIFERMAEVEEVHELGKSSGEILKSMWKVRGMSPHLFIAPFPSNRWQYSMLAAASGAERKLLHSYPVGNFTTMRCCVGEKVEATRGIHDVVQNLRLLSALGIEIDESEAPKFESGGGGLVSTAGDYARFLQMLLNRGKFEGIRYLSRKTIELMTADHLGPLSGAPDLLLPGYGFGLGFAVRLQAGISHVPGSVGQYFWGGLAGTTFWVDPAEELFAIMLIQGPGQRDYFRTLFRDLVYAAFDD